MFLSLFFCPTIVAIQRTLAIHGFFYQRVADLGLTAHIPNVCHATQNTCTLSLYLTSGLLQAIYVLPSPSGAYDTCLGACLLSGFRTRLVGWFGDGKCFYGIFFGFPLLSLSPNLSRFSFEASDGFGGAGEQDWWTEGKEGNTHVWMEWMGIAKTAQGDKM